MGGKLSYSHIRLTRPAALPIRAVEVRPTSEPVTTSSGRQVKLTERAQAASEEAQASASGRRNKGKNTTQVKDKEVEKSPVPPAHQKKNTTQPSSQRTEPVANSQAETNAVSPPPPQTTTEHMKHRPLRSSNLRFPPILSSTAGTTPSQSNDTSTSEPSTSSSTDIPKASGSSGSKLTVDPPSRLKIKLPPPGFLASAAPATNDPESTSSEKNSSSSQINTPADVSDTTDGKRMPLRSRGARPRGPRNGRGPGCGQGRGNTSLAPNAEATTDNTESLPTEHPVDTGNAETSATAAPLTPVYALRSSVSIAARTQPHGVRNSIGTRADGPLLPANDPGHPKKKRKLDDCED